MQQFARSIRRNRTTSFTRHYKTFATNDWNWEQTICLMFFRPKFCHGRSCGMSVPQCLFLLDLEGLTEVVDRMSAGRFGHGEVRVYRGTGVSRGVRRTNRERSLKKWELSNSLVLKSFWVETTFWDSSLLVSLTLWVTPVLFMPPLPLAQEIRPRTSSSG